MRTGRNEHVLTHIGPALGDLEDIRRWMNGIFAGLEPAAPVRRSRPASREWPRLALHEDGESYVVTAVVPGLSESELSISLEREVLTLSGKRNLSVPEGYELRRRERGSMEFSRSLTLPGPVDAESATARVKDGLLTVRIARAEAAKIKQITVEKLS